jgi:hypothetical protein
MPPCTPCTTRPTFFVSACAIMLAISASLPGAGLLESKSVVCTPTAA